MQQLYRQTGLMLLTVLIAPVGTAATYTVTSSADSGVNTLRAAIELANTTLEDDSIVFDSSINTITLADNLPEIASIAVGGKLLIQGNGAANTIISGANAYRTLRAGEFADVELNALTLTQGNAGLGYGGAAYVSNNAKLTAKDVTFSNS